MGKRGHEWIQRNLVATELAAKFDLVLSNAIAGASADAIASQPQEATA
jgi:hypothetical protein